MASKILVNAGTGNGLLPTDLAPVITWTNIDLL